jgi:hypothetical protein
VRYADGNEALLGDIVAIDEKYRGVVVANIDGNQYADAHPGAQWSYLGKGILVETDFGGLVHYEDGKNEHMVLVKRGNDL